MKVIIIDDENAMHLIMKRMLAKFNEIEIVGLFHETTRAYELLMEKEVDLAFVDIQMSRESGLDFAIRLRKSGWLGKLVFVTSHKEYALPAFNVYAYDYIVKPISEERLRETLRRVLAEKANQEIEEIILEKTEQNVLPFLVESLTKREIEVMQLMSNGSTNKQIAVALGLREGTIKNHIVNIFGKLQVKNRVRAITVAKKFKLIH
ncbi:response regulator transcription factor [Bacillus solitudinis]|uniref:response regulator transcription factor n=1 Tax=Bacillus solitudinis TaxID=2014074 RepID=UPI000C23EEA7|nr:response regulator transcription factor [Bacillus solitudinis]